MKVTSNGASVSPATLNDCCITWPPPMNMPPIAWIWIHTMATATNSGLSLKMPTQKAGKRKRMTPADPRIANT